MERKIPGRVFLDTCVVNFLLGYGEQIHDGGDLPSLEPREISMTQGDERLKSELVPVSTQERADLLYYLLRSLDGEAKAAGDAELDSRT